MLGLSDRRLKIVTGLISITMFCALVVTGVKVATGTLKPRYQLTASFGAAGQGLQRDSDIKIHGVDVGSVKSVKLVNGRANVRLELDKGERIPVDAKATIRPKTLFGEKFVDIEPGPKEANGPFLHDEGTITKTLGGFELEQVLTEAYPILKAVDPAELGVILDTLARGADGEGSKINRQIVNWQKVADVSVAHDADTRQFLDDLVGLTDQLASSSGDLVGTADNLNVALPELNAHAGDLTTFLERASSLSGNLADVLEANKPFLDKSVTEGGKTLQLLFDERGQIPGLVRGLREFVQILAEVTSHPDLRLPDGTQLAAVKFIAGGGDTCGHDPAFCSSPAPGGPGLPNVPTVPPGTSPLPTGPQLPSLPTLPVPKLGVATSGAAGITQLLGGLAR
jgi:phospholipid/cholesterol/gamma-HCH transport system substrate-binding protein